jgi:hypothetical protein
VPPRHPVGFPRGQLNHLYPHLALTLDLDILVSGSIMGLAALVSLTDELIAAVVKFSAEQKVSTPLLSCGTWRSLPCLGVHTRLEPQAPNSGIFTPKWS